MALRFLFILSFLSIFGSSNAQRNVLLIISDDVGLDYTNGYQQNNLMPTTPHIDAMQANGITFKNMWAAPVCTPTRASWTSGKHGNKTGVKAVPGNLDSSHFSLFKAIETLTNGSYVTAQIGKWHISSGPTDYNDPYYHGLDYYSGVFQGAVPDYYNWTKIENATPVPIVNQYVTENFTQDAIQWINGQSQAWFLCLAHVAPHTPYHVPPSGTYSIGNTNNNKRKFVAAIESMDYYIGQLLDSIPQAVLDSTLIIYLGDNGTPGNVMQNYPNGHGKGSLYEGGVNVPLIISGAGVSRQAEIDLSLTNVSDLYATILEYIGASLPGGVYNSLSFDHLFDNSVGQTRDCNYMDFGDSRSQNQWAIRNSRYKLIDTDTAGQLFFDLLLDSLETNNLIGSLSAIEQLNKDSLETEALQIQSAWSCKDHIQNGDEVGIDCGGTYCAPCSPNVTAHLNPFEIVIYPNPADENVVIEIDADGIAKIMDMSGRLLTEQLLKRGKNLVQLNGLQSGVYVVQILSGKLGLRHSRKIIKR